MGKLILDVKNTDLVSFWKDAKHPSYSLKIKEIQKNSLKAIIHIEQNKNPKVYKEYTLDFKQKTTPVEVNMDRINFSIYPKLLRSRRCYIMFDADSSISIQCRRQEL